MSAWSNISLAMQASSDGEWRWDPESVLPGEIVLMPSYRFAKLHTVIEPEGTRIFVDCIDGSLLCKHGELGTSIGTWMHLERAAQREKKPLPSRPSICDCTSTHGLHMKKPDTSGTEGCCVPASVPASLFDHLCAMNTTSILVQGREARQLPSTTGDRATFLTSDGRTICRHGRLRKSLMRMRQRGKTGCACEPAGLPRRCGLAKIALGASRKDS